jgi:hypothetical protein
MKTSEPQVIDVRTRDEHYLARRITDCVNEKCVTSGQSFVILLVNLDKSKIDFKKLSIPDIAASSPPSLRVYSLVDLCKGLLVYELENMCLDLITGYDNQCRFVFSCHVEFLDTAKDIPIYKEKGYPEFIRDPVPVPLSSFPVEPYTHLSFNLFDKCVNYCNNVVNPCKMSYEQMKKQRESDDAKLALCKPNERLLHDTHVKMMRRGELEAYRVRTANTFTKGLPNMQGIVSNVD